MAEGDEYVWRTIWRCESDGWPDVAGRKRIKWMSMTEYLEHDGWGREKWKEPERVEFMRRAQKARLPEGKKEGALSRVQIGMRLGCYVQSSGSQE